MQNYSSSEAHDSYKVIHEKSKDACDTNILIEFDRTVKKYADNLMHALEGVSSRLSQLEGKTHTLESALDDMKLTISIHNGSSDGKLKQLENIMREVTSFLILCFILLCIFFFYLKWIHDFPYGFVLLQCY